MCRETRITPALLSLYLLFGNSQTFLFNLNNPIWKLYEASTAFCFGQTGLPLIPTTKLLLLRFILKTIICNTALPNTS